MAKRLKEPTITSLTTQTSAELNEKLKDALSVIEEKLTALGAGTSSAVQFKTSGSFKYNELDGNTVNLFQVTDPVYLLKALSKMKRIKEDYDKTAEGMGLKTYPVASWYGYPVDSWIHDIEHRARLVLNATQITELNKSKTELTAFLSQEDRLKDTLTKVSSLLK